MHNMKILGTKTKIKLNYRGLKIYFTMLIIISSEFVPFLMMGLLLFDCYGVCHIKQSFKT